MTPDGTSNAKAGPSQPRKRKAGGDGKKGKVFLEGKVSSLLSNPNANLTLRADLLSLISNVTSSKDAVTRSRIDKQKAAISEHPPKAEEGRLDVSRKKMKSGKPPQEKKSAKRERALVRLAFPSDAGWSADLDRKRQKRRSCSARRRRRRVRNNERKVPHLPLPPERS